MLTKDGLENYMSNLEAVLGLRAMLMHTKGCTETYEPRSPLLNSLDLNLLCLME